MSDPLAPDEQLRLATLYEIDLLDTPDEPVFDRVTRLVAALLNVPVAAVSLIDDDRQWLKSRVGNPPRESPRNESFCTHTITSKAPLIVEDARIDERFANSPLVNASHGTRFYAGIPLFSSLGLPLGALCAIDTKPRTLSHHELAAMQDLAAILIDEIHLRERLVAEKKKARESQQALSALHRSMESQIERRTRELNLVIESAYDAYVSLDTKGVVLDWNRAAETMFGWSRKNALAQPITALIFPEGLLTNDEITPLVCNARRYDGSELSVEVRVKSLIIDGNKRFSLFIHDITERQQLERLRDKEAREDVLTQLPNRRALNNSAYAAFAASHGCFVFGFRWV
jgi:PAS domain S-box-containing protein